MSNPIKLAVDQQTKQLVSYNGSVTTLPSLYQSNVQDFQVQVLDPTGSVNTPYTVVDMSGDGLRLSVGPTPTGSSGGPAVLALVTGTWDSTNKRFNASLALNTTDVDTFIGTAAFASAFFELNLTESGNRITILQTGVTLRAVVDELGSTVPTPADQYPTLAEADERYSLKKERPGVTHILVSPSGVYGRELGVADDGSAIDNIVIL